LDVNQASTVLADKDDAFIMQSKLCENPISTLRINQRILAKTMPPVPSALVHSIVGESGDHESNEAVETRWKPMLEKQEHLITNVLYFAACW
jgi:hypothetical protein